MEKLENKEIFQAVLMADNFNDHFKPFTSFNSPVSKQISLNKSFSFKKLISGTSSTC